MDADSRRADEWADAVSGSEGNDALRVFLAERDEPCPQCGYNLRGLTAAVCPECKHALRVMLDADYAGIKYLWILQVVLVLLFGATAASVILSAWTVMTTPLFVQNKSYMTWTFITLSRDALPCGGYVFAWIRVHKAKQTGLLVMRAYLVTILAMCAGTMLVFLDWILQWVASWMGW